MHKFMAFLAFLFSVILLSPISSAWAAEYLYIGQPEVLVHARDYTTIKLDDPSGREMGISTSPHGFVLHDNGEALKCNVKGYLGTIYARIPLDVYPSDDFNGTEPLRREYVYVVKAMLKHQQDLIILTGHNEFLDGSFTSNQFGFSDCPIYLGVDSNSDGGFIFLCGGIHEKTTVVIRNEDGQLTPGEQEELSPYIADLLKSQHERII